MGYLKPYLKRYAGWFVLAVIFLSGEAIADLMQPTMMARLVDEGVANRDISFVLSRGAIMLVIALGGALAATGRNLVASNTSQRFGADLRFDLYRKTMGLSFSTLDRMETATLVTRLTNDVTQVQNFVNGMMRIFVKAPLLAIGGIVMAILLDRELSRVLQIALPVVGLLVFVSLRIGYPRYRQVQKRLDGVNGVFREYLGGARVVKAFNRFDYESERFEKANRELARASTRAMYVMAIFMPGIRLSMNLGIVAVLWLGGYQVEDGGVGVGHVIAFVNYMIQILFALMITAFIFNTFVRARASSERIREVMTAPDEHTLMSRTSETANGASAEADLDGAASLDVDRVRFEGVTFSYGEDAGLPALRDVTFACATGETLGVIGSTGSGKSTLIGLIPRFRDATGGAVMIDGVNARDLDERQLRSRVSIVPQQTLLFSGSVIENIRWGRQDATEAEVVAAAQTAQAHEFIQRLPGGYRARIGRGGVNLSGGQKQRVSIARALIRRPEILILDDASSALDSVTEARLRQALRSDYAGTTLIIVAQRVTSVMDAERIVVLDDGATRGVGTHEELLRSSAVYRDIHRSQIGITEDDHV